MGVQVQTDTLSHFVLARGSMFSLAGAGELDYIAEATAAGHIYASNTSEVRTALPLPGPCVTTRRRRPTCSSARSSTRSTRKCVVPCPPRGALC